MNENLLLVLTLVGVLLGFAVGFGFREANPSEDALMWIGMSIFNQRHTNNARMETSFERLFAIYFRCFITFKKLNMHIVSTYMGSIKIKMIN